MMCVPSFNVLPTRWFHLAIVWGHHLVTSTHGLPWPFSLCANGHRVGHGRSVRRSILHRSRAGQAHRASAGVDIPSAEVSGHRWMCLDGPPFLNVCWSVNPMFLNVRYIHNKTHRSWFMNHELITMNTIVREKSTINPIEFSHLYLN